MDKSVYYTTGKSKMCVKQLGSGLKAVVGVGLIVSLVLILAHHQLPARVIVSTVVLKSEGHGLNCDDTDGRKYFKLQQDDPEVLEYVRRNVLEPPMPVPYNLDKPLGNPTEQQPQYRVALKLLNDKTNGFFVEAGANNGEYLSNTLVLERDFGWTGLLVEPDTRAYAALKSKHRKAWLANACLSTETHMMRVVFREAADSVLSKTVGIGTQDKGWKPDYFKDAKNKLCVPLYSLLAPLNLTVIDYFSLDVEGADLQVLKTIPFDKIRIKIISVEVDKLVTDKKLYNELLELMWAKDYVLATTMREPFAYDHIFAHKSILAAPCSAKHCGAV